MTIVSTIKQEIHDLIDVNEIQSDSIQVIAAIEQSHLSAKNVWSVYTKKPVGQIEFERQVSQAVQNIAEDNPFLSVEAGEISAIDAIKHVPGSYGLDIRPKVFDNITQSWILLDSGSCVTCTTKKPGDSIDPNFRLRSVNGGIIPTYGSEEISVRIGRKEYKIKAIKVVPQRKLSHDN